MKLILPDTTLKHLLRIAQNGETNEPANTSDRSGNDWDAICNELTFAKRDENGYIELSRRTFDWVVQELTWAFVIYWNK